MRLPKQLVAYVDGASRGNPGHASYGVCFLDGSGNTLAEFKDYIGIATNSVAEYSALIRALREARDAGVETLEIYTDSQLVARQFDGTYRIKHEGLRALMAEVRALTSAFKAVAVRHIMRSSHPGNKRADKLANIALDTLAPL